MTTTTLAASTAPQGGDSPKKKQTTRVRDLIIGAVAIGVAAIGASFFLAYTPPEAETPKPSLVVDGDAVALPPEAPAHRYLTFDVAAVGEALPSIPSPGRVEVDELKVMRFMAPLAGRVESAPVRTGQTVQEGELLVSVRSGALTDLDVEVKQAEAALSGALRARERVRKLVEVSAAAAKDLVDAEREVRQAQLSVEAAKNRKKALSLDVSSPDSYRLVAPRAGVVLSRDVSVGEQVSPERGTPLVELADLSEVLVVASVTESDAMNLSVGQRAQVRPLGSKDREIDAAIAQISEVVDPVRRTVEVRMRVDNRTHGLRANAFVEVFFEPATTPRVVVPARAVVTDNEISVVFVKATEGHNVERRVVEVGRMRDGRAEILAGLAVGERYVSNGALLLLNAIDLER